MIAEYVLEILTRNLDQLKQEISLYKNEADVWLVKGDIKNPPGNLVLHLTGNLKHYIGYALGNTGYVRQRDKEFSDKNLTKKQLLAGLDEATDVIKKALSTLSDEQLAKPYPVDWGSKNLTVHQLLFELLAHFNYHLGQVNYHRRLIS